MLFANETGRHLDVFVGTFAMCHELRLDKRLAIDPQTLTLSDLLLSKLQIAEVNQKDVLDTAALLSDHELSETDEGLNVAYVVELLSSDWGWWRTVTENLERIAGRAADFGVPASLAPRVRTASETILSAIDEAPKSMKWRLRAKAGDKLPWREDPEELG